MLQLYKNDIVTSVAKGQVELRKRELDWYTNNYLTMSTQGAVLAGFAFNQLTTPVPEDIDLWLGKSYLVLSTLALSFELFVVLSTTMCCILGPGLALRGHQGFASLHVAVDTLKSEQNWIFFFFVCGLLVFLISNSMLFVVYYIPFVAYPCATLVGFFILVVVGYVIYIYIKLHVPYLSEVDGKIQALHDAYGNLPDIEEDKPARSPSQRGSAPGGFPRSQTAFAPGALSPQSVGATPASFQHQRTEPIRGLGLSPGMGYHQPFHGQSMHTLPEGALGGGAAGSQDPSASPVSLRRQRQNEERGFFGNAWNKLTGQESDDDDSLDSDSEGGDIDMEMATRQFG